MAEPGKFFLSDLDFQPAYLSLPDGELTRRAREAIASLENCKLCPRRCGANRLIGRVGTCSTGLEPVVSSFFPHFGEETCLSSQGGSGTIFFNWCCLRCVFCQNYEISQATSGQKVSVEELAGMMLSLQKAGCHNINLVTPDHNIPQILAALEIAIQGGLRLPLVYNTAAYVLPETLAWLDGVVDIYLPDFKMADAADAKLYLQAKDYPEVAVQAIREMHRQTGDLRLDELGLAKHGVLVRHLVMPDNVGHPGAVMEALADISTDMYVNIMAQYHLAAKTTQQKYQRINRPAYPEEIAQVYTQARDAGLWRFDR